MKGTHNCTSSLRASSCSRGNPALNTDKIDCRVGAKAPPRNDGLLHTIAFTAKKHGIRPLKKYGQNFIFDMSLCQKIVRASQITEGARVLEIGPGTAGLTRAILEASPSKLTVIETDSRFVALLQELQTRYPNLEVIQGDALKFDIKKYCHPELDSGSKKSFNEILNQVQDDNNSNIHIISNLPYNIGTKLLINWFKQVDLISSITIMLQKEVVDRIRAVPNTKEYGRLSVICGLMCDVEKCFDVSRSAFYPPPKVESSVVRLVPKTNPPSQEIIAILEQVTSKAFGQRRKTLKSSLKELQLERAMYELDIDSTVRAENLSPKQYLSLANHLFLLKSHANPD
jgi:16S rRNA (adenine1518-N6/adenine1519-N6)-dimethyltransferase